MGRLLIVCAALALLTAPPAAATPQDPYGDDWIAIAVDPDTGVGGYGASGTSDGATQIALSECKGHCQIASVIEYGCVAFVLDTAHHWAGGRGPDIDTAQAAAAAKLPDPYAQGLTGGSSCSTPTTPP